MRPIDPQNPTGSVLNIQHFCTHDGPGMRTTVVFKGCSLRWKWCSNPESIHPKPEIAYDSKKCIGKRECGFCLKPGRVYEMEDFKSPSAESLAHLRAIIDEAFRRKRPQRDSQI
jgi:organic radical activating enzyme